MKRDQQLSVEICDEPFNGKSVAMAKKDMEMKQINAAYGDMDR